MKKLDLSKLSHDELESREKEFRTELQSARLRWRLGQFKQTSEFDRIRKEIARINTRLTKLKNGVAQS
jgi:ribosomal protein L29